jgi:predicted nucleic acid-binding protein
MRVLVDNNIVIDALNPNPDFEDEATEIFRFVLESELEGFVCSNNLTDIYYVLRKHQGVKLAKANIRGLLGLFNIIPLTEADCTIAISFDMNDFEDAIIMVCAKKVNADYIISRDKAFIAMQSPIPVITPAEFLKILTPISQ